MPSVQMNPFTSAVAIESIGTGSASRPHTLMGWVRAVNGGANSNTPLFGSFRIQGTADETTGNIGYTTQGRTVSDSSGGQSLALGIVYWDSYIVTVPGFPETIDWYYVVLQLGSGSNGVTNLKIFKDDQNLTKVGEVNGFFATVDTDIRYMGINGSRSGDGGQYNYVRAYYSGAFTDDQCRDQARSTTPVSHPSAVLWEHWPLTTLNFTGSVNNKGLRVVTQSGAIPPILAPDQPRTFITSRTIASRQVTGSSTVFLQNDTNPMIIR